MAKILDRTGQLRTTGTYVVKTVHQKQSCASSSIVVTVTMPFFSASTVSFCSTSPSLTWWPFSLVPKEYSIYHGTQSETK
mmetsp:Transcript_9994/g.24136  ORF Transcript_9994/g.24136 Transcript_9994/m.24136 type:complete len:80 (+) Transcript_9994:240-479(+)